jgi:glycosyltransferase involved in cell wall biosynthesis
MSLNLHRRIGTFHTHVTRFVALTGFTRQLLIRDGYPADKITVKANSVADLGAWPTPTGTRYVTFVGRLLESKGVRTLLDAWRQVPAGLQLRIAGDGPLRGLVEERAAKDPSIEYLGWLDSSQRVAELMGGADAVLVPSEWYEGGAPLVVLRSLSFGTPVIVPDLENICEHVVTDDAGFTFATGSSAALGRLMTSLATDPVPAYEARPRARASFEARYTPSRNLKLLESIYQSVMAERPSIVRPD